MTTLPSFTRLHDRLREAAGEGAAEATRAMEQGAIGSPEQAVALALTNRDTAARAIARKIAAVLERRA